MILRMWNIKKEYLLGWREKSRGCVWCGFVERVNIFGNDDLVGRWVKIVSIFGVVIGILINVFL